LTRIEIGRNVLFAERVFLADSGHGYGNVCEPVSVQLMALLGAVSIGDDCWVGINVVVIGNVRIGRHVVVGANSVVTRDLPDYSVACGAPARVIRLYDPAKEIWIRT
jgi:acetyltransferase-like isoleucine patch superfamily enzyme